MEMAFRHEHGRGRRPAPTDGSRAWRAAVALVPCLAAAAALGAGLSGCQGPGGYSLHYYGAGHACSKEAYEASGPVSLAGTLEPLQSAFDADAERPRIIALLPHLGCERGAEILREQVLDAFPSGDLRLYVIWQDIGRRGDREAARRASQHLDDPRVTCFHDASGLAGRSFARGKLPVAEAREVFLFYPAGIQWPRPASGDRAALASHARGPSDTPTTESWVHQLGRVAPETFCSPRELPGAMRARAAALIADADRPR